MQLENKKLIPWNINIQENKTEIFHLYSYVHILMNWTRRSRLLRFWSKFRNLDYLAQSILKLLKKKASYTNNKSPLWFSQLLGSLSRLTGGIEDIAVHIHSVSIGVAIIIIIRLWVLIVRLVIHVSRLLIIRISHSLVVLVSIVDNGLILIPSIRKCIWNCHEIVIDGSQIGLTNRNQLDLASYFKLNDFVAQGWDPRLLDSKTKKLPYPLVDLSTTTSCKHST